MGTPTTLERLERRARVEFRLATASAAAARAARGLGSGACAPTTSTSSTASPSRPSAIFDYLAEHENLAEVFGAKVTRLRDGEDGERNGVGSVRELQIGPLPPFEETVTEFVPNERIVYRITKGSPLRGHVGVMTFDAGVRRRHPLRTTTSASPRRLPGVALIVRSRLTRSIRQSLDKVERDA